ncbi:AAA family ATPase [Cellulomonas fengjieae]|uniref:AAA family ATPase n=1 Tax=Cellulomonas fengjieae TaxID=2819978 RepID=A0ABS3SKH2_9CELL|nr:AAA family ATPase [Cellulomonas fengjieae]MBO3086246.1 AAA family ATPase [Cellulomonas fengjieae]MBO3102348.1 AAA family ATPase [Cellulomonas fengjieae]QVI65708.1 AAA family ATPase [Cellulomonas fengjieae]
MIQTLAVEGYRSLRALTVGLGNLTVVTGANGSGKTSVYRALRLLAEVARDGAVSSLAREGGMRSAVHAGRRTAGPVAVRLGVATEDLSYAIDLGLPQVGPFKLDPEIKSEVVWAGPVLRPSTVLTERTGSRVRTRDDDGAWTTVPLTVHPHESVMALLADPAATPDLFALREQARRWRFYDHLRTDTDSPARRPGVATYTPVLSPTGDDLAAALLTIQLTGDVDALQASVDVAFPGSRVLVEEDDGVCRVAMTQPGLRRALSAAELSDGTLTFLLLAAAAHATRPPDLLVLNEPESSLHPALMPAVAALVASAAERSQVLVVTHAGDLVRALRSADATTIDLVKDDGVTSVAGAGVLDGPAWNWPTR